MYYTYICMRLNNRIIMNNRSYQKRGKFSFHLRRDWSLLFNNLACVYIKRMSLRGKCVSIIDPLGGVTRFHVPYIICKCTNPYLHLLRLWYSSFCLPCRCKLIPCKVFIHLKTVSLKRKGGAKDNLTLDKNKSKYLKLALRI